MPEKLKILRWTTGLLLLLVFLVFDIFFEPLSVHLRFVLPLLLAALLCLWRIVLGPTAPDRIVATDILGILVVGFCALVAVETKKSFYMDIAIAWALQSFIGMLALAKFIRGKGLDE